MANANHSLVSQFCSFAEHCEYDKDLLCPEETLILHRYSRRKMEVSGANNIWRDIAAFIKAVSRIIWNSIVEGHSHEPSPTTLLFYEADYLRPRWLNQTVHPPFQVFPVFTFSQIFLERKLRIPSVREIFDFIKPVFEKLTVQKECLLMMLIYIDRLTANYDVKLRMENWRPLLYIALLLASKIIEDRRVLNIDFVMVYTNFSLKATNFLEIQFAQFLEWSLFVCPEQYSNYYRHLKILIADKSGFREKR